MIIKPRKHAAAKPKAAPDKRKQSAANKRKELSVAAKPKLLAGDNTQIAKGYGDAPVQAYLSAIPGWKGDVGRRVDAIIMRTVPGVRKAVKWNTPFYGVENGIWFLGFHCMAMYIKVAFFRGTKLRPVPPGDSTQKEVRYLHIHEDRQLNESQFIAWEKPASRLPGRKL